ncbi:MAG: ChaN family lipoprotein [Desulfoarculaceae bacterium]|nr:ChaN family lipoprotein [Desulfoarculaceae bacterium]
MLSSSSTSPLSLSLFLLLSLPLLFLLFPAAPAAAGVPSYELAISFQPEEQTMSGTAHISLPAGQELILYLDEVSVTGIMITRKGQEKTSIPIPNENHLHLLATDEARDIFISYTKQIPDDAPDNMISEQGIVLTSRWHPIPDRNMQFKLTAMLPRGFKAISEADTLTYSSFNPQTSFSFSQPVQSIHFIAGPYIIKKLKIREDLLISTWFFKEDASLSNDYLDAAARYIKSYEQEIGTFPYNHYAIVANRLPSGFGMPTFTLLGQQVLRLPFIKDISLGHEILHSWFGNSINVRPDSGNWSEGLTSYLADYAYAEDQGQGAAHRQESIINYLSYVSPQTVIPLGDFRSASHNQPMAKAIRAVGYNRGAMLFHELRGVVGPEPFLEGVRQLYQKYRGQEISWEEIKTSFEQAANQDLQEFFQERLTLLDIPDLSIANIQTDNRQARSLLTFTVEQRSETPFTLALPIVVKTTQGEQRFLYTLSQPQTTITLAVDGPPTELVIDPDHDLLRVLTPKEMPPVWSRFLGAPDKTIVVESESAAEIFAPLLQTLVDDSWKIMAGDQVRNQDLATGTFLFLGINGPASRSLFATPDHSPQGFTLDVRANPLNPSQVAVLMSSSSAAETAAALPKLPHYGKYSRLHFQQGQIKEKTISASDSGIHFILEQLPAGGSVSELDSFDAIIDQLNQYRVIYVGENHTSMADHLLQFRIIEALHRKNPDLAIGMEMFPGTSQVALDAYINDETISEQDFLRDSRYFEVWRYDWRFFRAIFNYARRHKIPVIGLNLEREIVSKVFADGHTDNLSAEQKTTLPESRNLDLPGYTERLGEIHGFHSQNEQAKKGLLTGFIQSQAIWDDTMAATAARFLTAHTTTRMVILAGSQHTRKDSGIPPRMASRLKVSQASVLNLSAEDTPADIAQTTDFFFLAPPVSLEPGGKMGLVLDVQEGEKRGMKISDISPLGKAGQAGVQKDDILIAINNSAISSMADIHLILLDKKAGDHVTLRLLRPNKRQQQEEKEVDLELFNPEMTRPAH